MENSMVVPQKTRNRTTLLPSNSTPEYISEKNENSNSKRYMHPNVHSSLFTIAKKWKQPKCPSTDDWIKKMWYTHTHIHTNTRRGILLSHKKEWNSAICSNVDGPREYYPIEIRQKDKNYMISLMWNIKNNTNECIYKTETGSQVEKTNLWLPKGRVKRGRTNYGYGINRCK